MNLYVISLGGSIIVPDDVDYDFLKKFKEILFEFKKDKFVIVTGGGSVARKYIKALDQNKSSLQEIGLIGMTACNLNAKFLIAFLGLKQELPKSINEIKYLLRKNNIVCTGTLEFKTNNTSDGEAALLASELNCTFINLTNVNGLYTKDPKKFKDAKLISNISYKEFDNLMDKIKFKPGQHFVLDQNASHIIMKHKLKTVLLNGKNVNNFKKFLQSKEFIGTIIS